MQQERLAALKQASPSFACMHKLKAVFEEIFTTTLAVRHGTLKILN
jgi:hypothetical protein